MTAAPGTPPLEADQIAGVRSFHRMVTERVGALHDHYLGRHRPLGESRLLWEIGDGEAEIRQLRGRLGLDSGYISRLLTSLEEEGLVRVGPSPSDRRVRSVRLTTRGRRERATLDRLSDSLVGSLLEPLSARQRQRLTAAMAEVERLLVASMVELEAADPTQDHSARWCLESYFAELGARFERGFDPATSHTPDPAVFLPPGGLFLLARLREEPVGCGALQLADPETADLKRMWVAPKARGLGLGRRLLAELERRAAALGATTARLDTNRALTEAVALYRSAGYEEVEPFSTEPYAHHWFAKKL
ncbi:MAG: MarR family winged helix-turn-helix transcriptional regulator [Thermoanaerobaculia bacterium]